MATGVEVFMSGGVRYRGTHRWQWGANICTVEGGGEGVPEGFKEFALTTLYHLLYQRDRGGLPDVVGEMGRAIAFTLSGGFRGQCRMYER